MIVKSRKRFMMQYALAAVLAVIAGMAIAANEGINRDKAATGLKGKNAITDTIVFDAVTDPELQKTLNQLYSRFATSGNVSLVVGYDDLNADGTDEMFVLLEEASACNTVGCLVDIYNITDGKLNKLTSEYASKVLTAAVNGDRRKNVVFVQTITVTDPATGRTFYDDGYAYAHWQGDTLSVAE